MKTLFIAGTVIASLIFFIGALKMFVLDKMSMTYEDRATVNVVVNNIIRIGFILLLVDGIIILILWL